MTLKERLEAKRWGYKVVLWCRRVNGVPFHQGFMTVEQAEDFAKGVKLAGGTVVKFEMV